MDSLTVVIATRDRPADLDACLRALVGADDGRLAEIVVVDDGSRQPVALEPTIEGRPVVVLRHEVSTGPDRCRNEAVQVAGGDFVAFLDDDARVAPDWFSVAGAAIESGMRAFTGRVLPLDRGLVSRSRQWRYDQRYGHLVPGQPVDFLAGGNSVVAREAFLQAGGFPERKAGGDNGLVGRLRQVGIDCRFVPGMRILHRNSKGFATAARQAWHAGRAASPAPLAVTVRECATALARLGAAPVDVRIVNGALQLLHSAGRIPRKAA